MRWFPKFVLPRFPGRFVETLLLVTASACGGSLGTVAVPSDAGVEAGLPAPGGEGPDDCDVPSEPHDLLVFLRAGDYRAYSRESAPHSSTGPHGGRVLTYVNDLLARSLQAGNPEHPRCAASVKELFLGRAEVSGWAVFVKTKPSSEAGQGFYWFETTSTDPSHRPEFQGFGVGLCVGCHASGRDHFRAPWPLQ